MCGRINGRKPEKEDFEDLIDWELATYDIVTHKNEDVRYQKEVTYNICPTDYGYVLYFNSESSAYELTKMRFGLIPAWARGDKKEVNKIFRATFNARSETVFEKPSYREAIKLRRCIVLIEGWHEWPDDGSGPYYIHSQKKKFIGFGGIWDRWQAPEEKEGVKEVITSMSVITTPPGKYMAQFHSRSPLILKPSQWKSWMTPELVAPKEIEKQIYIYEDEEKELTAFKVDPKKINNVRWKERSAIEAVSEPVPQLA